MRTQNNKTLGPTTFPRRHLFLDTDSLVKWDVGIYQNFPRPERVETTGLECGPPGSWDARCAASWGSVLYDQGRFRLWGAAMRGIESLKENCDIWLASYSESEDGIHWRKPDLKLIEQKRWPGNNLLKLPGVVMSVVRPLAGAGFKFLALTIVTSDAPLYSFKPRGLGSYLFGSDDGIHWKQLTKNPMVQHGDAGTLHVDHARQRYLLYYKAGSIHGLTTRRSVLVLESKDAIHWEGYHGYRQWHEAFVMDDYDDLIAAQNGYRVAEDYSFGHGIHQVEGLYLTVQTLFMVGLPMRLGSGQNPNGRSHLRLAFSHDGMIWRYPRGRPVWMEGGPPGEFGAGFVTTCSNIVEHGEDMWLFCQGIDRNHGWGIRPDFSLDPDVQPLNQERRCRIFVAKLKRDRFASLAANQTSYVDVEIGPRQGETISINAVTRHAGSIRVAIAEQNSPYHLEHRKSDSLPGFSFDDGVPITGDHVKAPVEFRKAQVAELPKGKFLVLRLEITGGEVFGYEWTARRR